MGVGGSGSCGEREGSKIRFFCGRHKWNALIWGVVLKIEMGGRKKVGGRSDHIVVKIPQKIYSE